MRQLLLAVLLVAMTGCASSVLADGPAKAVVPVVNSIGMRFVPISTGTFTMGDGEEAHQVTLTQAFHLGQHEVTQEQYERVMGSTPSRFKVPQNPVEQLSWNDAVEFCRKLSDLPEEKSAGHVYRLPTEAEWEYACRAGTATKYSFGNDESKLSEYCWFLDNADFTTHPVGQKKPNAWGLYDMHGNVWEWCQDRHLLPGDPTGIQKPVQKGDYPGGKLTDPTGPSSGSGRVYRGGGWYGSSVYCRSSLRGKLASDRPDFGVGFRVLRSSIK